MAPQINVTLFVISRHKAGLDEILTADLILRRDAEPHKPVVIVIGQDRDGPTCGEAITLAFCSQKGGNFLRKTTAQLFLKVYAACRIDGASSHSGRRTLITRLADHGISVHVLAVISVHRNIVTTRRYLTVNDALIARAAELA